MDKSYEKILDRFKNPSTEFNPVTMWFWNGKVTKEGITRELEEFRAQGIYEFFIHPAEGAEFEYLSDEFMELIQYVVAEAKRLGMKYWIYDEFDWPSGVAGGLLTRDYPEFKQWGVVPFVIDAQAAAYSWKITHKGKFLCALSVTEKDGKSFSKDVSHLFEIEKQGDFLDIFLKNSYVTDQRIYVFIAEEIPCQVPANRQKPGIDAHLGYVDMLNYDAITKYIELTHERYKKYIGEEFGKTVMGVFTDEPTTHYDLRGLTMCPWTEKFPEEFEKRRGYSIMPYMYALAIEAYTPFDAKVKDDYYRTLKEIYHENFTGQIANWCNANGLKLTGHYGGEETLGAYIPQGDMQTELMLMEVPGMDTIWCADKIDDNNYNIAGKLVSGAAKFADKDRILSETYTCSYWNLKLPTIKRIANRLIVTGANMVQFMGAWYAVDDRVKWPGPAYSYQNTLYKYFHKFSDYMSSLQSLSAATRPDANTLLFIPLAEGIALDVHINGVRRRTQVPEAYTNLQRLYEDTLNALLFEGIGFDLISENLADRIEVKGGKAYIGDYCYGSIVLPSMEHTNSYVASLIEKLRGTDVKVIFLEKVTGIVTDKGEKVDYGFSFAPVSADESISIEQDENAYLIKNASLPVEMTSLRRALTDIIGHKTLNFESEERVYVVSRSNENCEVYFISNDENKKATVTVDILPGMEFYNPETRELKNFKVVNGKAVISLAPYELCVGIRNKASALLADRSQPEKMQIREQVAIDRYNFKTEGDNQLPLHYTAYDPETDKWYPCENFVVSKCVYLEQEQDYKLRATVNIEKMPEELYIHGESRFVKAIRVNGNDVKFDINLRSWCDYETKTPITQFAKVGENVIELDCVTHKSAHKQAVPFMMVTGNFGLDSNDVITEANTKLDSSGWENQGYTYYSGDATYEMEYVITREFKKASIRLTTDDVATLYVNGKEVECRLWEPYEIDVTDYITQGVNKVSVLVTSTMGNMFMKEQNPSRNGLLAPTRFTLRA